MRPRNGIQGTIEREEQLISVDIWLGYWNSVVAIWSYPKIIIAGQDEPRQIERFTHLVLRQ